MNLSSEGHETITVGEIFDYADAVNGIQMTENTITNPSKLDVYLSVDGKQVVLKAGETLTLDCTRQI